MRQAWRGWWLMGLLVPIIQWPMCSIWESGRLSLAVWMVAAGALGMCEPRPQRASSLPVCAALLGVVALWQLLVIAPSMANVPWTHAWGFVASFNSMACWFLAMCFGLSAVLRHAPDVTPEVPPILCGFLSVNLLAWGFQHWHLWSWWRFQEFNAGLFPNQVIWGAWCAMSLPVLWAWRRWAILPAAAGLLLSQSSSALLAVGVALAWAAWPKRTWAWCGWALGILGLVVDNEARLNLLTLIEARLHTWQSVLVAIVQHPMGIGWSVMAYGNAIHARTGVLPHPASDVLRLILEAGWLAGALLAWSVWRSWPRLDRRHPYAVSLVVCGALACWQNVLSLAQAGCLALVVWCLWRIQMEESCPT